VLTVVLLLLIPLIAMQFTHEVDWSLFDFVLAGVLLLGTGLMCELVMRKVNKAEHRIAICLALLIALLSFGQNLLSASSGHHSPERRQ